MKTIYKAFRELEDGTLQSIYAPTKYKVGKVKVFRKCPTFASNDISSLRRLCPRPGVSIWKVAVDNEVEVPRFLLPTDYLTVKNIRKFWNNKLLGTMPAIFEYGYMKVKPIEKVEEYNPEQRGFRKI